MIVCGISGVCSQSTVSDIIDRKNNDYGKKMSFNKFDVGVSSAFMMEICKFSKAFIFDSSHCSKILLESLMLNTKPKLLFPIISNRPQKIKFSILKTT